MTALYAATVTAAHTVRNLADHLGDLADGLEAHAARLAPFACTTEQVTR